MNIIERIRELRGKSHGFHRPWVEPSDLDTYHTLGDHDLRYLAALINADAALLTVVEAAMQTVDDAAHVSDPYGGVSVGRLEDALAELRNIRL